MRTTCSATHVVHHLRSARLHAIPKLLVDDAQFGHLLHDPLVGCVQSRHTLPTVRILDRAMRLGDSPVA
ncbi:hypothetical protein TSH58_13925 [Azospirillum sp. TSH58]|nr:hypothetical protein TSH58_13925 [Azospirillum sp. TSH58]